MLAHGDRAMIGSTDSPWYPRIDEFNPRYTFMLSWSITAYLGTYISLDKRFHVTVLMLGQCIPREFSVLPSDWGRKPSLRFAHFIDSHRSLFMPSIEMRDGSKGTGYSAPIGSWRLNVFSKKCDLDSQHQIRINTISSFLSNILSLTFIPSVRCLFTPNNIYISLASTPGTCPIVI